MTEGQDAPYLCPDHHVPFCNECLGDCAQSDLIQEVHVHPLTRQVIYRWVHKGGCPASALEIGFSATIDPDGKVRPTELHEVSLVASAPVPRLANTPGRLTEERLRLTRRGRAGPSRPVPRA